MERLLTRVLNQIKICRGSGLHVLQKIGIVRDVLKYYNNEYTVKRGYLNIDGFGTPMCFTYFWLENDQGETLDIIKYINPTQEKYFFTEDILAGTECIDGSDCAIMSSNNSMWKKVGTKNLYTQDEWKIRQDIVSKHPMKIFQM